MRIKLTDYAMNQDPGATLDVPEPIANELINRRKAVRLDEEDTKTSTRGQQAGRPSNKSLSAR